MHAEEVGVEDGCEADLLDGDLGQDGEEFGGVVEVIVEEHEPGRGLVFESHHIQNKLDCSESLSHSPFICGNT